jgi:hypothetical protein
MLRTDPAGAEPLADRGDVNGGLVADGELVIPRDHNPVAPESADTAFDV